MGLRARLSIHVSVGVRARCSGSASVCCLFKKAQQARRHKCAPMSPRGQLVLCVQVAILWLLALSGHAARSAGDQASAAAAAAASADQITNVNDALKYLREIDKYYAQVARPIFH